MSHGKAVAVGHARRADRRARGREAIEVYGPPARLAEVEAEARTRGWPHAAHRHVDRDPARRRSATGRRPTASAAPANLEDVFVLLTGEEIA